MPSKIQGHYSYSQHPQITQKLPLGTELLMIRQRFLQNTVLQHLGESLSRHKETLENLDLNLLTHPAKPKDMAQTHM
jgi:hypothetical protein